MANFEFEGPPNRLWVQCAMCVRLSTDPLRLCILLGHSAPKSGGVRSQDCLLLLSNDPGHSEADREFCLARISTA